jgi:uncharacterized protein
MTLCVQLEPEGVRLMVKVVPGAARDRIVGVLGDALKIQVAAPPEKGRANDAVESLLAKALGIKRRDVRVTGGHTSPRKTILVRSLTAEVVRKRLGLIQ